jgi:hypothetical protein
MAATHAQFVAQNRWWETHTGEAIHNNAAGQTLTDRFFASGAVNPDGSQSIDPAGGWPWAYLSENVFYGDGLNPCESVTTGTPAHVANYLGNVPGSGTHPQLYAATACYAIYSTRTFACVQSFVAR